jgi:hypothetical protein
VAAEILQRERMCILHIPEVTAQGLHELIRVRAELVTPNRNVKWRLRSIPERTSLALTTHRKNLSSTLYILMYVTNRSQ